MRFLEGASPWLQAAVSQILATFSGEDGSVSFVQLLALLKELDRRARDGDEDAAQAIACVRHLSRLIDIAKRGQL